MKSHRLHSPSRPFAIAAALGLAAAVAAQPRPPQQPRLHVTSSGSVIQVENGVYRAAVSSDGGFRVDRLLPGGHVERAISSDEVILGSTAWKARTLRIEDTSSFYVRVSATATLGDHAVREIWEFTRSGTIHAQVEVRPGKHSSPATTLLWRQVCDDTGKVRAQGETDDVWVQRAIGPLGGLQQPWPGVRSRSTPVARSGNRWERAIALPPMTDGQRFLSNVLLLVDATQHGDGLPVQHYPWSAYDFYAEHGLLTETATGFTFIDWNNYKYLMDALVPVELSGHRFREDTLIRTGVHLRDRLALDDGWVRAPSWSGGQHTYPHGDRFTTSARSYPALVYLWAHLTMDQVGDRWVHVPGDGDCFYHQLQRTLPFLDPRSPSSFSDLRSATGTPYLAYSLALRERSGNGPRGVINSHAHALHFAAQMREASEMFGDATAERAWREVVLTHHRGSKELLPALHPATRDGRTYLGLVNYSENQPSTHPSVDYSSITFEALPAGYELAAEHDPIFALAVERWCRYRTDPFQPAFVAYSDAGLVQRLWRLMPTTFAFAPSVEEAPRWFAGSRWATWFTHPEIEVLVGDFGGDQRADVLKFDVAPDGSEGPGGVWVGTSTGASFTTRQWATWITNRHTKVLAGNFDGRGKTDIMKFDVRADGAQTTMGLWVGVSDGVGSFAGSKWADWVTSRQTKVLAGDFNGDGKDDVMKADVFPDGSQGRNGLWVGISTGSSFSTSKWDEWTTSAQTKVLVGDFNGDGKDDVMKVDVFPNGSQGTNGLWVGISTGSSFVTTRWADWVTSGQTKLLAGDFDDDGRCDVMKFDVLPDGSLGRNGLWVGLSEGSRFRTHDWGEWDTCGTMKVLAGDFGGDAACDVMKFDTFANPGNFGLWVGISTPYEWRPNTAVGRNLAVVGIREALGGYQPVAEHDPRHYVVIDGGRKVARTNSRFASTWAPGFFEEKKDEELPLSRRFGVTAVPYPNRREGHFGAAMVREGNGDRVEIMLDYDAESVVLYLAEGNCDFAVRVRRYQGGDTWGAPVLLQSGVLGRGPKWLALGWMHEKDLMLVELRNRPE